MRVLADISFTPWNKGKLVGQKSPPQLRDIWATNSSTPSND
ncbi:integrase [Vreelandella nanhaiensis]|uniref:Integrase n=1 Tax=Vreelandella nanhaiensis TaxID=1258546 RepID=A0A3S0XXU5_9GAMM|nr:integrase [Halomonas nanhaiensis]